MMLQRLRVSRGVSSHASIASHLKYIPTAQSQYNFSSVFEKQLEFSLNEDEDDWKLKTFSNSSSLYTNEITNSSSTLPKYTNDYRNGSVLSITNSIANISGFKSAKPYTMVNFENNARGLVLNVNSDGCHIGMLDNQPLISVAHKIKLDYQNWNPQPPTMIVGPRQIGRIVDVFGNDFIFNDYQKREMTEKEKYLQQFVYKVNIFPNRKFMTPWHTYSRHCQRIHTDIKIIDTFYPMGRGLKTALIGDKELHRSELAIDILLSFSKHNEQCSPKDS